MAMPPPSGGYTRIRQLGELLQISWGDAECQGLSSPLAESIVLPTENVK